MVKMKTLKELFSAVPCEIRGDENTAVTSIEYDSRRAGEGSLLFCLRGAKTDGHVFAPRAYEKGCRAFAVEYPLDLPSDAVQVTVDNTRRRLAEVSAEFYGRPADKLTVIGITGTKGKTTTAVLIEEILSKCGVKCAYIGTNGVVIGENRYETINSTPESRELHRYFSMMLDEGFSHVVMEVSSQALDNYRVHGIKFDTVIFTNLSPDHIGVGEHASFEEYRDAKRKLFTDYGADCVITNADDEYSGYMTAGVRAKTVSYGIRNDADLRATGISPYRDRTSLGVEFDLRTNGKAIPVRLRTPGEFSVYNGLAAIAAVAQCGISPADAADALRTISVRGRFEIVDAVDGVTFIIDYAHNGLSLTRALTVLREYSPSRLICVFGCIGGRTFGRRRELAEAAASLADFTVITSDNPDNERPEDIIDDVLNYFDRHKPYTTIADREEAVRFAVRIAKKGDIVLFAGKGHENFQLIDGERVPLCEREIILDEAAKVAII